MKATNRTQSQTTYPKTTGCTDQMPLGVASTAHTASNSSAERPTGFDGYTVLADGSLKIRTYP